MRILVDTNVVLRLGDKRHVMHGEALATSDVPGRAASDGPGEGRESRKWHPVPKAVADRHLP